MYIRVNYPDYMYALPEEDIIHFLKENIQPLDDHGDGPGYRASATLKDGTFLPCVIFRNPSKLIDRAIKRISEEKKDKREIVKYYAAKRNCINPYNITKVGKSRFAFSLEIQRKITGETSMSWTAFVARFKDGRHLGFGTTWNWEFFDLPEDFNADDIVEIINHSYLLKTGEIVGHRSSFDRQTRRDEMEKIYVDRPFFECYLDHL